MSDYLPIILTIAVSVLTVMLIVVGVYIIQVLQRLKETLDKVNTTVDVVEHKISAISSPIQNLMNMSSSIGAGLKVFDGLVSWLNRNKSQDKDEK